MGGDYAPRVACGDNRAYYESSVYIHSPADTIRCGARCGLVVRPLRQDQDAHARTRKMTGQGRENGAKCGGPHLRRNSGPPLTAQPPAGATASVNFSGPPS